MSKKRIVHGDCFTFYTKYVINIRKKQQLRERLVENLKKEKTGNEEEINKYIQLIEENLN